MSSGWSRERVGSRQRRHSSTENGQRVYPGQQLLVYGRHAYATGQRPQPQGKRVTAESATVTRTNKTFETYRHGRKARWIFHVSVRHFPFYECETHSRANRHESDHCSTISRGLIIKFSFLLG